MLRSLAFLMIVFVFCVPLPAQKNQAPTQPHQDDDKILKVVSSARNQVDNFAEVLAAGSLEEEVQQGTVDAQKANTLLREIDVDTKNERQWEQTVWTIPHSELLTGEFIESHLGTFLLVEGTAATCRKRFPKSLQSSHCGDVPDTAEIGYVVEAPLDARAHILMEGLRHGISHYAAIQDFRGKPTDDAFITGWNSAWFDARNVYCRHSPGSKYLDLSNQEQVCK